MDNYASAGFMQTASGKFANVLNPTVDQIDLEDIVTAANRIIRFAGHSRITLAEHSCRVHDIVAWHFGNTDPYVRRAALMHDAHEAYVVDIPSPLKAALRLVSNGPSTYDQLEEAIEKVMAEKFDFPFPHPPVVKEADTIALAIEADLTWGEGTAESWGLAKPISGFKFNAGGIEPRLLRTQGL